MPLRVSELPKKVWRKRKRIKPKLKQIYSAVSGVVEYNLISQFKPLAPKEMIINLTYWCNSRCKMCNIWQIRPQNEMTFKEWEKIMQDQIFKKIEVLTISGGEATLHQQFNQLADLFIDSMPRLYQVNVITNGFMTDYIIERVEKLLETCEDRNIQVNISVSVDGIGDMHEDIRRIPNAFKKTSATLFRLKDLMKDHPLLSIGSGSLILRQNLDHVDIVIKWFKEHNIPLSFQIVGFHKTFVDNLETQKDLDFKNSQYEDLIETLKKVSKHNNSKSLQEYYWNDLIAMYRDNKPRTTPCPFLKDQFVLDSWGNVHYCLSVPSIGNCRKTGNVSAVYYSDKNLAFRKRLPQSACKSCNSGCNVQSAIAKDFKHYAWFKLTGKMWYGWKNLFAQNNSS